MTMRRVCYRLLWVAVFALPLWVLLGRAFFGVPLGLQFVGQLLLVPLLFVGQAVATGVVVGRRSVRRTKAVSWPDVGLLSLSWLGQLGLGFFVVDSSAESPPSSAFTQVAGGVSSLDLSTALFALCAVVTIAAGVGLFAAGLWQFAKEARARMATSLADLERAASGTGAASGRRSGLGDDGPVITIRPRG
ncbi:hypothetical protein ITJ55_03985 [Frigoribacterium sp. VKM Ac-1396]|uniref:hypothetical protein n=1 Tax=Frigoribacterium sp. VKM Ac-1396 TaxID=2783821 RepID=UPI00188AA695|nr:hypothetical protein [Frigoribacterium sp. VKM Ac-1396]MBF4599963.1 hypothetical protein [Frigoribacterium sp. VKM Ac-1396]